MNNTAYSLFLAHFPSQVNAKTKLKCQYIIYKRKMHIKQDYVCLSFGKHFLNNKC